MPCVPAPLLVVPEALFELALLELALFEAAGPFAGSEASELPQAINPAIQHEIASTRRASPLPSVIGLPCHRRHSVWPLSQGLEPILKRGFRRAALDRWCRRPDRRGR